jgi:hypothetical protein
MSEPLVYDVYNCDGSSPDAGKVLTTYGNEEDAIRRVRETPGTAYVERQAGTERMTMLVGEGVQNPVAAWVQPGDLDGSSLSALDHFAPGMPAARQIDLKLYQFPAEFEALGEMLEETEGEVTEPIRELLDSLKMDLVVKVQHTAHAIFELRQRGRARVAFGENQVAYGRRLERAANQLEDYLATTMNAMGKDAIETPTVTVDLDHDEDGRPFVLFDQQAAESDNGGIWGPEGRPLGGEIGRLIYDMRERQIIADAAKQEADRIRRIADYHESAITTGKKRIMELLRGEGLTKLDTPEWSVRIQRNSQPTCVVHHTDNLVPLIALGLAVQPPPPPPALDTKAVRQVWKEMGAPETLVVWEGEPVKDEWAITEENPDGVVVPKVEVKLGYHLRTK